MYRRFVWRCRRQNLGTNCYLVDSGGTNMRLSTNVRRACYLLFHHSWRVIWSTARKGRKERLTRKNSPGNRLLTNRLGRNLLSGWKRLLALLYFPLPTASIQVSSRQQLSNDRQRKTILLWRESLGSCWTRRYLSSSGCLSFFLMPEGRHNAWEGIYWPDPIIFLSYVENNSGQ